MSPTMPQSRVDLQCASAWTADLVQGLSMLGVALIVSLVLAAHVHAIPPAVMEPYRAYMAAIEADDLAGAVRHAEEAYQAGVAERVDTETLAALAENRAQIYDDTGNHRSAASAWNDLALLLQRAGADRDARATALVNAALMHSAAGDAAAALRASDAAARLFAPGASSELLYLALSTKANAQWQRGRIRDSARTVQDALAVRETLGPASDRATMNTAMIAAIHLMMRHQRVEGAFYVSLAARIAGAIAASAEERMMLTGWEAHLRERMTDEERAALSYQVAQSVLFGFEPAARTPGERMDNPSLEGLEVVGARLVNGEPADSSSRRTQRPYDGFAVVMFDIEEDGRVQNVRALISVPQPEWGQMSEMLAGFRRYEPRTVGGVPTRQEGVVVQYEFQRS